jgi:hypothetical protein
MLVNGLAIHRAAWQRRAVKTARGEAALGVAAFALIVWAAAFALGVVWLVVWVAGSL